MVLNKLFSMENKRKQFEPDECIFVEGIGIVGEPVIPKENIGKRIFDNIFWGNSPLRPKE